MQPPPPRRSPPLWLLALPCAATAFGDRALGPPFLRVGDVLGGAFLVLWCASRQRRAELRQSPAPWSAALAAFVCASLLSGAVAWLAGDTDFAPVEFLKSAARLLFGAALALCSAAALRAAGPGGARLLQATFVASALVGLGLYAAFVGGIELPQALVCGQDRATCSSLYYERRWFGDASPAGLQHDVFARAQGLASEPTRFGTLQALALGALLLRRPLASPPGLGLALVALGGLASFALAPYALMALAAAVFAFELARAGDPALRRRVALWSVLLLGGVLVSPLGPSAQRIVAGRLARMAQGGLDSSALLRVSGGWSMAAQLAASRPLTGVGLGQFDVAVAARRAQLPAAHLLGGSIQGWNALGYVLGTTGGLGLLAFAALLWRALRAQPWAAPVFVLGLFADGTLLAPAFWILLAFYAQPSSELATGTLRSAPAPPGA